MPPFKIVFPLQHSPELVSAETQNEIPGSHDVVITFDGNNVNGSPNMDTDTGTAPANLQYYNGGVLRTIASTAWDDSTHLRCLCNETATASPSSISLIAEDEDTYNAPDGVLAKAPQRVNFDAIS